MRVLIFPNFSEIKWTSFFEEDLNILCGLGFTYHKLKCLWSQGHLIGI